MTKHAGARALSDLDYLAQRKLGRRDRFPTLVEAVTLDGALLTALEPFGPRSDVHERLAVVLKWVLHARFAQLRIRFSDEGMEDTIYTSQSINCVVGIKRG